MARSRSRASRSKSSFDLSQLDQIFSKMQLWLLLTTVVVVPLVVLPESNFVDITSTPKTTMLRILGTLQAGVLVSRLLLAFTATDENRFSRSIESIRQNKPVMFVIVSITAVTVVSLISAVFSILPSQSWWGRTSAGFEAGEFTFLMYVSMSISAFISIQEHSNRSIIWNTLAVTGICAGLIGFFQFFGWSPLDISSTHNSKLTGTNGNPIFYGAMLVLLIPVTCAVLLNGYQKSLDDFKRWWLAALAASGFIFALALTATASRGPWLGIAVTAVFVLAVLVVTNRLRMNFAAVGTLAVFAILGAATATFVDPTPAPLHAQSETTAESADDSESDSLVSSALGDVARTNTLDLRMRYWRMSANMALQRDPVPHTNDAPVFIRSLFGYGPDMFRFAGTYFSDHTTFTRRLTAAHNDPINRLVEQGFLGFLSWISLWLSIAYASLILIRRSLAESANSTPWIPILVAGALAGRFVEQMFGSPTPGGVLVFWILVGALAGLLLAQNTSTTNRRVTRSMSPITQYGVYFGVAVVSLASIALAWDRGASYLIANQMVSFQYRPTVVSADDAIKRLEAAAALAPDVPRYWHDLAEIEHGRANSTENPGTRAGALSRAYEYDLKAHLANPLEVNSVYKLAFSAWEAGNAGRPELRQEAVDLYTYLTEIIPSDELARERLQILTDFMAQQSE